MNTNQAILSRGIAVLSAICIFSCSLFISGTMIAKATNNLLINGDFSEGAEFKVPGWTTSNTTGAKMTNEGIYLNVWWGKTISQTIDLSPNTEYTVVLNGRVENGNSTGFVTSVDKDDNVLGSATITSTQWSECTFKFKTGNDAVGTIIKLTNKSTNFRVKKVELYESNPNLVVNGDFSEGEQFKVPGWTASSSTGAKMTNDGIYLNVWWGKTITQTVDLLSFQSYKLTVEGKVENDGSFGIVTVTDQSGNELGTVSITSKNWDVCSLNFKTGKDAQKCVIKLTAKSTNFRVRKVSLFEAENDPNLLTNGDLSQGTTFSVPGWKVNSSCGARMVDGDIVYLDVWSGKTITQSVKLDSDTAYQLTFKAKRTTADGKGIVTATDDSGTVLGSVDVESNAWAPYNLIFSTGKSAENITINLFNSKSNLNISELSLAFIALPIRNGDAEVHGTMGWKSSEENFFLVVDSSEDTVKERAQLCQHHNELKNGGKKFFYLPQNQFVSYEMTLDPKIEYELSLDFCSSVNILATITGQNEVLHKIIEKNADGFQNYSIRFKTNDEKKFILKLTAEDDKDKNAFFAFDNISVSNTTDYKNKPEITEFASQFLYSSQNNANLFPSGDFETTPENGWNVDDFIKSGILDVSSEKFRSGKKSLYVHVNGDETKSAIMWLTLDKDTDYVLSMSLLGEWMSDTNLADMTVQLVNFRSGEPLDTSHVSATGIMPTRWDNLWHRRAVEFSTHDADIIGIKISGKSASCYIDDVVLCKKNYAMNKPSEKDIAVDPNLNEKNFADSTEESTDIVTCAPTANILGNTHISDSDLTQWQEILGYPMFGIGQDRQNNSNSVLQYENNSPRNYNILKTVKIEPKTRYAAYVRIRGDIKGNVAFTVATNQNRLVKYTPERWDGVWQTFSTVFDSNDSTEVGIGFMDGGGSISVDDMVLCKYEDATFSKAPDLPPLKNDSAQPTVNPTSNSSGSNENNYQSWTKDNSVTVNQDTSVEQNKTRTPIKGKTKGTKGRVVYN